MARIIIKIEAEVDESKADEVRDSLVNIIETAAPYMADNVLVTSQVEA